MAWALVLIGIFLLPFFSTEVFKVGSLFLYLALLVFLLFFSIRTKSYLKDRSILFTLLALFIIIIITTIFSSHPGDALGDALNLIFCIMVFALMADLDHQRKNQIALVLIGSSFFISAQALLQRFFYFDRIIPYLISQQPQLTGKELFYILDIAAKQRVVSMFDTPNLLASYLVMVNLIIFGCLLIYRGKKVFFVLLALLIINTLSLWFTRSFWGLVSFIFGILLFFGLVSTKVKREFKPASHLFFSFAAVIFILFTILFIRRFFYASSTYNLSYALQGRLQFWKAALRAIADRPLSFLGLGNFGYLYPTYSGSGDVESTMAHNLFLQLWIETGPYGLLAFIVVVAILIFKAVKDRSSAGNMLAEGILRRAALCSVCVFLFDNMSGFSFFILQTSIIWWILCALSINIRQS